MSVIDRLGADEGAEQMLTLCLLKSADEASLSAASQTCSCLRKLGEEVHKSSDWVKGSSYDRLAMIESLLDHKADPNLRAGPAALLVGRKPHIAGKTALEIAKEGKYPAVANFLEALPARTFAAHPYGCRFVEKATAPFAI